MNCSVCRLELNPIISWPECGKCHSYFHYKCTDGAMHQATWRCMTPAKRLEWSCSECSVPPVRSEAQKRNLDLISGGPVEHRNPSKRVRSDVEVNLPVKLDQISEQLGELLILPGLIFSVQEQLKNIRKEKQASKYNLEKMDDRIARLETENLKLRAEIKQLRTAQDENLQHQDSGDLIISEVLVPRSGSFEDDTSGEDNENEISIESNFSNNVLLESENSTPILEKSRTNDVKIS